MDFIKLCFKVGLLMFPLQFAHAGSAQKVFKITCSHKEPFIWMNCQIEKRDKLEAIKQEYLIAAKKNIKNNAQLQKRLDGEEALWKEYTERVFKSVYEQYGEGSGRLSAPNFVYNKLLKDRIEYIWKIWLDPSVKPKPIIKTRDGY